MDMRHKFFRKNEESFKLSHLLLGAAIIYGGYKLYVHLAGERPDDVEDADAVPEDAEDVLHGPDITTEAGEEAEFYIFGEPGCRYSITVYNPSDQVSESQGLEDQVADDEGYCEWQWMVGRTTSTGDGRILIQDEYGRSWEFGYTITD